MMTENKPSRPGEAALRNMMFLKKESNLFKVPKVPKNTTAKKKKTQVLDEDDYVESIGKIIQRDFFPDLEKLHAQNEYLEATENKDYNKLRELSQKYSGRRPPTEPYNSPATFDTPHIDRPGSPRDPTASEPDNTEGGKMKDPTEKHSLDSFLASHTSEDNASYDRVISLEQRKRDSKLATQFAAEVSAAALADRALELPSIEQQADQTERPTELVSWRYSARNHIMYVPGGAGGASSKPELQHRNTRLQGPVFDHQRNKAVISAIAKSQEATVTGKIAVDGSSVTLDKPQEYTFVGTPSPRPGLGPDQSPLMTWGEIEGTPFRLDGGDTPLPAAGSGAAYHVPGAGARERLAHALAERARRPAPQPTPPPARYRTNTERLASMSPAARKLAAKHLLSPRLRLTPSDVGIFSRLATPKTPQKRPLVATPRKLATPQRPSTSGSVNNSTNSTENVNITDNLLQINVAKRTRLKAQDFFS